MLLHDIDLEAGFSRKLIGVRVYIIYLKIIFQTISALKPGGLLLSVPAKQTGSSLSFDLIQKVSNETEEGGSRLHAEAFQRTGARDCAACNVRTSKSRL